MTLTLTPTLSNFLFERSMGAGDSPIITLVAKLIMLQSKVFETNGKERETLRLHSITFSWLSCKSIEKIEQQKHLRMHSVTPKTFVKPWQSVEC